MRVLLVGGSGFMGSLAARALRDAGHAVAVISRGSSAPPDGVEGLTADRNDSAALARILDGRRFDFTVDFTSFDAADIEALLCVPHAALGRYVLISSGQVYLVTENPPAVCREEDSDGPLLPEPDPRSAHHADWSYGVGKRRAEAALLALRVTHGVRGTILRLPVVQGEADRSLRLWAWLERMLDGGPIVLPEGGTRPTRFLLADDVARALVQLVGMPATRESVYNLAQPEVVSLREFLERVARIAGLSPAFVGIGWDEIHATGLDRTCAPYGTRWLSVIDPARAAGEWSFVASRLDDYLPRVVRWHLGHRPSESHPGYARRAQELELCAQRAATRLPS